MNIHPYPAQSSLRRAQDWQARPCPPVSLRRIAVHEAGHVIMMKHLGLVSPLATIEENETGMSGEAHLPGREFFEQLPEPSDPSGALAATAAAVFHAGVMAEMIAFGIPWLGPVRYQDATDFQLANSMLRERFGNLASGAHAFAQQVALHVLTSRWSEIEEVCNELERTGSWRP